MTWDEFRLEWYPEHCACFTGISAWMAKLEKSDGPASRDVMKSWYGVLRNVDVTAAKAASHKMHAGEIEEPKGFDRHPAAIRKACGGRAHSRAIPWEDHRYDANGNQTFACLLCNDYGWVRCWHPASVAKIAKDGFSPRGILHQPLYDVLFRCTCRAGDMRPQIGQSPRYDARRACCIGDLGSVSNKTEQDKLSEWLRTREPTRPKNYEPAFDDFS